MGSLAGRTQVLSSSPIPVPDTPALRHHADPGSRCCFSRKFWETFLKAFQNSRHMISSFTISINSR